MSFPRYPKYKSSGLEWLGDLPEHWHLDRMKWSTRSCKNGIWGGEAKQDENDIPCVRVADFDRQRLRVALDEPTIRNVTESERVGRVLRQGDLLLEKSGGGEGQPVGCVVLYDDPKAAVCSNFVAKVELAPGMNSSFWRYLHAAAYSIRLNTRSIKQTSGIQNLDQQQYLDEMAPFPSETEQAQIASFLDRETAKIDELVGEQRRLMELLKEKRQAVISHAVTQGLNPHAPRKPSGIEWLGDIPEHWRRSQPKFFTTKIVDGVHFKPDYQSDGVPFVTVQNLTAGPGISFENLNYISEEDHAQFFRRANPQLGDVLITKDGATLGVPRVIETDKVFSIFVSVALLKPIPELIDAWFLCYALESNVVFQQFKAGEQGSALKHIHLVDLRNVFMAIPPLEEQREIVRWLKETVSKIDTLTAEAKRAIDLLQERRTALISAAVTGQIDVRE